MGRGSVVEDVTIFGTTGHGMVVAGCQQMTFRHITVSRCGRVQDDTWSIYLTNSPTDGLETNANNWYDLQSHGGAPQGGLIAMRADQHPGSDHPRTQHFYGLNVENGPQTAGVPLIEVAGRDHLFSGGRLVGIDAVDNVFKAVAGNRARNIRIKDLVCIAKTGNNTTFYYSNGVGTASPSIADCEIQTDGIGIHLDFYNQTRSGLNVSDVDFRDTPTPIKVKASKNVRPAVQLSNLSGSGEIAVQGAQLQVSNVTSVSWKRNFSHGFSPHIISDDGSFAPLYDRSASTNSNGIATVDFVGTCQFPGGASVDVALELDRLGASPYLYETAMVDSDGDDTPDRAMCTVYKRDGSPVGSGDVTVALSVRPH